MCGNRLRPGKEAATTGLAGRVELLPLPAGEGGEAGGHLARCGRSRGQPCLPRTARPGRAATDPAMADINNINHISELTAIQLNVDHLYEGLEDRFINVLYVYSILICQLR